MEARGGSMYSVQAKRRWRLVVGGGGGSMGLGSGSSCRGPVVLRLLSALLFRSRHRKLQNQNLIWLPPQRFSAHLSSADDPVRHRPPTSHQSPDKADLVDYVVVVKTAPEPISVEPVSVEEPKPATKVKEPKPATKVKEPKAKSAPKPATKVKEPKAKSAPKRKSPPSADKTLLLPDQILHRIFSYLPESDSYSLYLVCKRWLNLQGRLVRFLRVLDYQFLVSGKLVSRFPNLIHVDLVNGFVASSLVDSFIVMSRGELCFHLDSIFADDEQNPAAPSTLLPDSKFISEEDIVEGLIALANGCPNLRKLKTFAGSEVGLMSIAEECIYLQQLELHKCSDNALRAIVGCRNLQILKLVGSVDGLYNNESSITDIGLTIIAQGCRRLVKLELSGCEGSFDGIKAIAQCCHMLEELSLCDHRMEDGWLAAVSHFENLRSLRFSSCKRIDLSPGPDEHLGFCQTLEFLHLHKCHLRDKESVRALFAVCKAVKDINIQDCWGLDDDTFSTASTCRDVKSLSLEGASLLTTKGLESVLLSWVEIERLKVVSCTHIKDNEVSSQLSNLLPLLQGFKWMPDTKAHLSSYTSNATGKRGSKFFRKSQILKSL